MTTFHSTHNATPAMAGTPSVTGGAASYPLSNAVFELFRELIRSETGIALNDFKRPLVQSRLAKRLRKLGLRSCHDYYLLLTRRDSDDEWDEFINAMTTNTTAFFREPHHFEYLKSRWLPRLRERARHPGLRRLRVWSAGCSSGEEPYSIAMTLCDGLADLAR